METVWRQFTQGRYLRAAFLWVLRIVDILIALGGLALWIVLWIQLFRLPITVGLIVGGVIDLVLYIGALYAIVHTIWFRAGDIASLPERDLPAFDIISIANRLVGEVAAIVLAYTGVAGAILIWASGRELGELMRRFLRPMGRLGPGAFEGVPGTFLIASAPGVFLTGLGILVLNALRTIFVLLLFYALAEFFTILAGLWRNTRAIRRSFEQQAQPGAGPEPPATPTGAEPGA
jgi:hypothetical protein